MMTKTTQSELGLGWVCGILLKWDDDDEAGDVVEGERVALEAHIISNPPSALPALQNPRPMDKVLYSRVSGTIFNTNNMWIE